MCPSHCDIKCKSIARSELPKRAEFQSLNSTLKSKTADEQMREKISMMNRSSTKRVSAPSSRNGSSEFDAQKNLDSSSEELSSINDSKKTTIKPFEIASDDELGATSITKSSTTLTTTVLKQILANSK
jgi:hypothetical protein